MAYYSFTFTNTNPDQQFSYDDVRNGTTTNVGTVNHGDTSPLQQCWVGSDGNGEIYLIGSVTGRVHYDLRGDNENLNY